MNRTAAPVPWKHIATMLGRFAPLWVGCAVVMGLAGVGVALVRTPQWSASQPLLVRDEANGAPDRLGRFASQTDMKAAQETILEMAKNPEVVAAALQQIGPPEDYTGTRWPSRKIVESHVDECITVRPPKGAEFGSTEVIYLETKAETRQRSETFCAAVFEELSARLRTVRKIRADSIIEELTDARKLAAEKLAHATRRLQAIEAEVGSDLAELRSMTETIGSDGSARRSLVDVQTQLQAAELELESLSQVKSLLEAGLHAPDQLLVAGGDLLTSQPTLKRLKDGLIDAQLNLSRLEGRFSADHPKLKSAQTAEAEIRERLQQEISAALASMEPTINIARQRVTRLQTKQTELSARLAKLATIRADYALLVSEVRQRTEVLGSAEQALAEAEASRRAALSTNLVSKLGPPKAGDTPEGPGGMTLTAAAVVSGLVMGIGLVFLVAPTPATAGYGRRWSDYVGGRRASDASSSAASRIPAAPTDQAPPPMSVDAPETAPASSIYDLSTVDQEPAQPERRRKPRQEPSTLFRTIDGSEE